LPVVVKFLHSLIGERVSDHIKEHLWDSSNIMRTSSQSCNGIGRRTFCDWQGNAFDPSICRFGLWDTGRGYFFPRNEIIKVLWIPGLSCVGSTFTGFGQ
jgi:hypothetical protein